MKEIHFTLGSHLDLFWMGAPRDCLDRGTEIIGKALDLCEVHEHYRFYIESVAFAEHFLAARPEETGRLRHLVVAGKVEIGGSYADRVEHSHDGESILRHHTHAVCWMKETLGVAPMSTCHADLPGLSPQVPQILARCGIGFYVRARGICAVYNWDAPDGSSILYANVGKGYGRASMEDMEVLLRGADRFPSKVVVRGGYGDLEMPDDGIFDLVRELRAKYPQHKFFISSPSSVMEQYLRNPAEKDALPRIRGEWPFGWGNSGSIEVAVLQQDLLLENLLLTAEKITTAGMLLGHTLRPPTGTAEWWSCLMRHARERELPVIRKGSELREAWKAELFSQDHNYSGFSGPKSDHDRLVMLERATAYAQGIIGNALSDLCPSIGQPQLPGSQRVLARIMVFNPLSWERDDVVRVDLPGSLSMSGTLVVDEQGNVQDSQGGEPELSFAALHVPPLGYRPYFLVASAEGGKLRRANGPPDGGGPWLAERLEGDRVRVETGQYRMLLSQQRGCIEGIVSKALGRELALADGPRRFGELVSYVDTGLDVRYRFTGDCTRDSTGAYALRRVCSGPLSATYAFEGSLNFARVEKLVTLYRDLPCIDLEVVIYWWGERNTHVRLCLPFSSEEFTETWYGVPFHAVRWPTMMEGIEDSVILGMEESPDELASEDRRHFREVVKWVDIGYRDWGVTLAVKLPNMWIDSNVLEIPLVRSNRSCGDQTVWPDNSGRRAWSFRLCPHEGDWRNAKAYRTGWELNNPLLAHASSASGGSVRIPPVPSSFFRLEQDNVVLTAVKAADDGSRDVILRYYEAEGKAGAVAIECFWPIAEAHESDLLENPLKRLEVRSRLIQVPTTPYEIKTLRLRLSSWPTSPNLSSW